MQYYKRGALRLHDQKDSSELFHVETPASEDSSPPDETPDVNMKSDDRRSQPKQDEKDATYDKAQPASSSLRSTNTDHRTMSKGSSSNSSVDNFLGVGEGLNHEPNFLGVGDGSEPSFLNAGEKDGSGTVSMVENVNERQDTKDPQDGDFFPVEDSSCPDPDSSSEIESEQESYSDSSNVYNSGKSILPKNAISVSLGQESYSDSSNVCNSEKSILPKNAISESDCSNSAETEGNADLEAESFSDTGCETNSHPDTYNFLGVGVNGEAERPPDNFLQTGTRKNRRKKAIDQSEPWVEVKIEIDVADRHYVVQPNSEPDSQTHTRSQKRRKLHDQKDSSELFHVEQALRDSGLNANHSKSKDTSVYKVTSESEAGLQRTETSQSERGSHDKGGNTGLQELSPWQIKVEPQSDESLDGSSAMMSQSGHKSYAVSSALISSFASNAMMLEDMNQITHITSSSNNSAAAAEHMTPAETILNHPTLQHLHPLSTELRIKQEPPDLFPTHTATNTPFTTTADGFDATPFPMGPSSELASFVVKMEPESDQETVIEGGGMDGRQNDFSSASEEDTRQKAAVKKQTRARKVKKKKKKTPNHSEKPRPHHCEYCDSAFTKLSRLKEHTRVHTDERPFKCEECSVSFRKAESLKVHVRKHTGELPFGCPTCDSAFKCSQELKRHMIRRHTAVRPYSCGQCDLRFWSQSDLRGHQRIHTGERPYKCPECHGAFRKSSALTCHMRIHTGQKPYSCPDCDRSFRRSDQLKRHERLHSGEKPFSCSQCPAAFTCSSDLKKHRGRKHTAVKAFSCPECGNKFFTNEDLKMHRIFHMGIRPHACAECGSAFVRPGDLKVHMRIHTGEKPFSCGQCGATFARSGDLRLHLRMHEDKRPFTCGICNLSFRRSGHLTRHTKTHNGHKSFACEDCDAAFHTSSDLRRHATRVHKKDISKFGCTDCEARFYTIRALGIHMMKHAGGRAFPCSLCQAAFSHSDLLATHLSEIHGLEPPDVVKTELPEGEPAGDRLMYVDVSLTTAANQPGLVLDGVDVPAAGILSESV